MLILSFNLKTQRWSELHWESRPVSRGSQEKNKSNNIQLYRVQLTYPSRQGCGWTLHRRGSVAFKRTIQILLTLLSNIPDWTNGLALFFFPLYFAFVREILIAVTKPGFSPGESCLQKSVSKIYMLPLSLSSLGKLWKLGKLKFIWHSSRT